MAKKKKRGAPTKECVKCKRRIHARKKVCDKCGAEQPGATPAPTKAAPKRKVARKKRKPAAADSGFAAVEAAASFIGQAGGVEEAEAALQSAKRIANKLKS